MTEAKNTIELKDSERQPCEVWTRVMGYHRPVQSFNICLLYTSPSPRD